MNYVCVWSHCAENRPSPCATYLAASYSWLLGKLFGALQLGQEKVYYRLDPLFRNVCGPRNLFWPSLFQASIFLEDEWANNVLHFIHVFRICAYVRPDAQLFSFLAHTLALRDWIVLHSPSEIMTWLGFLSRNGEIGIFFFYVIDPQIPSNICSQLFPSLIINHVGTRSNYCHRCHSKQMCNHELLHVRRAFDSSML